ncbi:MAG: ABC transporter permease [Oscillospiraceae bacterium]|jgi:putative ABC transport system permease protein|nr:ABC transporter permease [Oscillospiraceae bacterium]
MLCKNAFVKITKSFGRYISLAAIVLLGVGFYSGVRATAPIVRDTAESYCAEYKLFDYKISATLGLTDSDAAALSGLPGVRAVVPSYSMDAQTALGAIRVHALETEANTPALTAGRLPRSAGECVAGGDGYALGDTVVVTGGSEGGLTRAAFTVTGLADSVLYLHNDYGPAAAGNGKLRGFIFIDKTVFAMPAYTELYVFADGDGELYAAKPERESARNTQLFGAAAPEGVKGQQWYIQGRSAVAGYNELASGVKVIDLVAAVLPLFFIVISALMTSNSMTRMITEERGEMGTLASLGYKDGSITLTYLLYVISATIVGAVAGFFIGCALIPPLIYSNFTYNLPPIAPRYDMPTLALVAAVSAAVMGCVTVISCRKELRRKPACLIRPLPPPGGRAVFLEKATALWRRLSFTWKITIRNMFRYAKRAAMTIVGMAGCTALLLTAFGLRDGMGGIARKQYGEIIKYSVMHTLKDEQAAPRAELDSLLDNPLYIRQAALRGGEGEGALDLYLVVPQNPELFAEYFGLVSAENGDAVDLSEGGAVITRRFAKLRGLRPGDSLTVRDSDDIDRAPVITDIVENYTSNYIYMDAGTYERVFGSPPAYNAVVSRGGDAAGHELVGAAVRTGDAMKSAEESTRKLGGVVALIIAVASLLAVVVLYNLTAINISERKREIATLKVLGFRDGEASSYICREALLLTLVSIAFGIGAGVLLHGYVREVIELGALSMTPYIEWHSYILSCALTFAFSGAIQLVTHFKLRKIDMVTSLKSVE